MCPWYEFARVKLVKASWEGDGWSMASISVGGADREVDRRGGGRGEEFGVWYTFTDSGITSPTSFVADVATPLVCVSSIASGCCAWSVIRSCCRVDCVS